MIAFESMSKSQMQLHYSAAEYSITELLAAYSLELSDLVFFDANPLLYRQH